MRMTPPICDCADTGKSDCPRCGDGSRSSYGPTLIAGIDTPHTPLDEKHVDLSNLSPSTYVSFAQVGPCKRCGNTEDLRMGACFNCADHCDGRPIPGGHEIWDKDNPLNRWTVREH